MRYIDLDNAEFLQELQDLGWEALALQHLETIRNLQPTERSQYFSNHGDWTKLYAVLYKLFHGKCWYSEAPAGSCQLEIEHFRPKARAMNPALTDLGIVKSTLREDGYWWLAYNWRNFRLAGGLVNKRLRDKFTSTDEVMGKGIYFPLDTRNGTIAQPESCVSRCDSTEKVILLDPTQKNDVELLGFDESGSAIPTNFCNHYQYVRAAISIEYLGLNHTQLSLERKKYWDRCVDFFGKAKQGINKRNKQAIQDNIEEIYKMCKIEAPFSKVAWCCYQFLLATQIKQPKLKMLLEQEMLKHYSI